MGDCERGFDVGDVVGDFIAVWVGEVVVEVECQCLVCWPGGVDGVLSGGRRGFGLECWGEAGEEEECDEDDDRCDVERGRRGGAEGGVVAEEECEEDDEDECGCDLGALRCLDVAGEVFVPRCWCELDCDVVGVFVVVFCVGEDELYVFGEGCVLVFVVVEDEVRGLSAWYGEVAALWCERRRVGCDVVRRGVDAVVGYRDGEGFVESCFDACGCLGEGALVGVVRCVLCLARDGFCCAGPGLVRRRGCDVVRFDLVWVGVECESDLFGLAGLDRCFLCVCEGDVAVRCCVNGVCCCESSVVGDTYGVVVGAFAVRCALCGEAGVVAVVEVGL